tara:strand:- start:1658 stop:2053 length:396 start_codon:yes stop_codon:yes gene_type:complete
MDKIIIYTNETCPYCKSVKQVFDEADIKYEERNTDKFRDKYNEITSLTGIPTVPTIVYKNNYFVGGRDFPNPQVLIDILKNFKPSGFNETTRLLEKLNTMNFYTSQAFNRIEQKINEIQTKINKDEHKSTD